MQASQAPPTRGWQQRLQHRFDAASEKKLFALCAGLSLCGFGWAYVAEATDLVAVAVNTVSMVLGSIVLSFRALLAEFALNSLLTVAVLAITGDRPPAGGAFPIALIAVTVVTGCLWQSARRNSLGLHRRTAESVLGQIRSQARVQNDWPAMPPGWCAEVALRPRLGAAVAGDFVSARVVAGKRDGFLELVVVDVSGHGIDAGPRALLLSGAVGGLLGAVEPPRLLVEVNNYVLRQRWDAGFATATYLRLDLDTYEYELRSAGHPPVVLWNSRGKVAMRCQARGTLLGVLGGLEFAPATGRLSPGDAMIFYTDGVVENREQTLDHGIDKLSALIEQRLEEGTPTDLADRIVDSGDPADDRTVVVLWNNKAAHDVLMPMQREAPPTTRSSES